MGSRAGDHPVSSAGGQPIRHRSQLENCQVGVFLAYASARGRALIDRRGPLTRAGATVQAMEEQTSNQVRYRVIIRGRPGEHLAEAFDHLEVDLRPGQTTLTGDFADQAQLHGLLDRLRDLGIHLISVNPVDQAPAPYS